jgi:hypothetical protein
LAYSDSPRFSDVPEAASPTQHHYLCLAQQTDLNFVEMAVDRWQELPLPANLQPELLGYSPFNPPVVAP